MLRGKCLIVEWIEGRLTSRIVYALYNRNARIGAFFSTLILIEATLATTCSSRMIGTVPFSPICDVEKTPLQVLYFTYVYKPCLCSAPLMLLQMRRVLHPMVNAIFHFYETSANGGPAPRSYPYRQAGTTRGGMDVDTHIR
jgi:hypothetical protein